MYTGAFKPSLSLSKFAPRLPVYAVPAPVPNVYAVPAVNAVSVELQNSQDVVCHKKNPKTTDVCLRVLLADSFHGTPSDGPSEPSSAASHGNLSPTSKIFSPQQTFATGNVTICRNYSWIAKACCLCLGSSRWHRPAAASCSARSTEKIQGK